MAFNVGNLVAYLEAEDKSFERSLDAGERRMEGFTRDVNGRLRDLKGRFVKEGKEAGDGFSNALGRSIDGVGPQFEAAGQQSGAGFGGSLTGALGGAKAGFIGAAMAIGAAAAAALGAAFLEALNFQEAQAELKAQLGLTADESERIGELAGDLYVQGYGESIKDVNNSIKSVILNMDGMRQASSEDLEDVTEKAMVLATVMGEDVKDVTAAVSQMMRTGLASSASEAFDIITAGAQLGADKSQDLLDTLNEYGTQFRKLGLDGQTAMGLIVQGLQAGARDADIVADAIKEFSIRAVDGSKLTSDGFKSIGLSAKDMSEKIGQGGDTASAALQLTLEKLEGIEDPVLRSQAAVALFGTQAEDLGDALYAIDPSTAVQSLGEFEGATNKAGDALHDTTTNDIESFKRSITTNFVNFINEQAIPAAENFAAKMRDELGPSFDDLSGKIRDNVLPPAREFSTWMQDNQGMFDPYKEILLELGRTIRDEWVQNLEKAREVMEEKIQPALDELSQAYQDNKSWIDPLIATIKDLVIQMHDLAGGAIGGLIRMLMELVGTAFSYVIGGWAKIINKIGDVIYWFKEVGVKTGEMYESLKSNIQKAIGYVSGLPDKIKGAATGIGNTLYSAGVALIQGLINGISDKMRDLRSTLSAVTAAIPKWKGPEDYDKILLRPAGRFIMGGLMDGIDDEQSALRKQLLGVSATIGSLGARNTAMALAGGGISTPVYSAAPSSMSSSSEDRIVAAIDRLSGRMMLVDGSDVVIAKLANSGNRNFRRR